MTIPRWISILVAALAIASCTVIERAASPAPTSSRPMLAVHAALPVRGASYLGVYASGLPQSYHPAETFAAAAGRRPNIVVYYSAWREPFQPAFARQAWRHGATVLVQVEPFTASVPSIAAGDSDSYLRAYASAVRNFGHPVILSFGHEVNGPWYPWGQKTRPRVYVAAWRHIVTLFRQQGADNVTWLWSVNIGKLALLNTRYPGGRYVNWIGVTGYYTGPGSNFVNTQLAQTIAYMRRLAPGKPVLIAETGIPSGPARPAQIMNLFQGARSDRLLGIVYFDVRQAGGIYHQDWRLEGHPASVAAFRRAVRRYMR